MRIWLQNFVSIQPKTSLEKSDVSWPTACQLRSPCSWAASRHVLPGVRNLAREQCRPRGRPRWSAKHAAIRLHGSLECSFSAGSTATIATKYSFFQVFRDLQNYLAKFSKNLQNFAKNQRFSQKSALFFFAKIRKFEPNFAKFFQIFAIFCKILQLFQKIS